MTVPDVSRTPASATRISDKTEALCWSTVYRAAPTQFGFKTAELSGSTLLIAPSIDILAYNRVLGFGLHQQARAADVRSIIDMYKDSGAKRFFLQLAPEADRDGVSEMLVDQGFRPYNDWAKFHRDTALVMTGDEDVDIRHATPGDAAVYSDILIEAFEWTPALSQVLSATIGHEGWSYYIAYVEGEAAACAALYMGTEVAALVMAGTRPRFRGLGLQSALIRHRLRDCARAGIRTAATETGVDRPEHPSPSFRNMRKAGFELAYLRRNWLFEE
jgi:GNAT superfamily N-acetyltransferase